MWKRFLNESKFCNYVTHVRDDEHRIQAHKDMVKDQDNTNNEIRTMANGQDKTKMINEGKFKKHKETEKTFHIASLCMEFQRGSMCRFNLYFS